MFTEPLTTPPTRSLQLMYAVLIGLLFPPQVHLGSWYTTPELALVIGNVFAYLISPRQKFVMLLSEKLQIAPDIMDFVFKPPERLRYSAGQYFEWTFQHPQTDSRGTGAILHLHQVRQKIHFGSGSNFMKAAAVTKITAKNG